MDEVTVRAIDFDTLEFASSMKGWELYSWTNGDDWYYSLLPGTNSLKTIEIVLFQPYIVIGEDSLKKMISCLPKGEEIAWISPEWIEKIWGETYEGFGIPAKKIQEDLVEFCRVNGYIMNIA